VHLSLFAQEENMKIAIDLLTAEKLPGGMLFAAHALLDGLAKFDQTNQYIIITGRPEQYRRFADTPHMHIHTVKMRTWRGMLIQHQLRMPAILKRIQPDLLHVPAFAAPLGWHGPIVLTVHDLAFLNVPQQSSTYARLYWRYMLYHSVHRAQRIIAISEQTRNELMQQWHVEEHRIHVIHNALRSSLDYEHIAPAQVQKMQQQYGKRYLLHVGRIMPRKNLDKLIQAFELVAPRFEDLHVVSTGGAGYGSDEVLRMIEQSPYRERIHLAGWVAEENLAALYAGASALVCPSRHEGFGLTPIEAMACGTPVVASIESANQAIVGDAVLRADCSTAQPLADAIARVLTDERLRDQLIQLGRSQAQRYSIEVCAASTQQVYQEALSGSASLQKEPVPQYSK
jgi:glycosyltransferase involved in cell wall biosynthesis